MVDQTLKGPWEAAQEKLGKIYMIILTKETKNSWPIYIKISLLVFSFTFHLIFKHTEFYCLKCTYMVQNLHLIYIFRKF